MGVCVRLVFDPMDRNLSKMVKQMQLQITKGAKCKSTGLVHYIGPAAMWAL